MKPYGRLNNLKGSGKWKVDYHVKKNGYVNWWEHIVVLRTRSYMKQKYKKEIELIIHEQKSETE